MLRKNRNIPVMLAITFLQGMVFYGSIATLYRQAAGIGMWEISLIESLSMLLTLALEVPWGVAAERLGYRRTLIVCNVLYAVSKWIFWRAEGFGMFLAERLLLAVVGAGLSGVDESILYLSAGDNKAQRVFGWQSALGTAGLLLASVVYTALLAGQYRATAFWTLVAYALAAVLTFAVEEVHPPRHEVRRRGAFRACLRAVLRARGLLPLALGGAILSETVRVMTVFLNQLQYVRCGWSDRLIGLAYIACTLAELTGALSHRFTRRVGAERAVRLLPMACALACAALAFTHSGGLSLLCMAAMSALWALFGPLSSAWQNRLITTGDRATALSVLSVGGSVAAMGVNLVLGAAAEVNLSASMMLGAALCAAACVLCSRAMRA